MLIRREQPADAEVVAELQEAAFGQKLEADLAVALRVGEWAIPEMSLVAEIGGGIVGHVASSTGVLSRPASSGGSSDEAAMMVPGLGPIGVLPEGQGNGVGSALMHASLGAADALGLAMVALLGSPAYYRRFGFVASTDVGVEPPNADWGEFFQVRTLSAHRSTMTGRFAYAAPFDEV